MDGEATAAAFATCSGPDCLKDVIPKLGARLKVYNALKLVLNKQKVLAYFHMIAYSQIVFAIM